MVRSHAFLALTLVLCLATPTHAFSPATSAVPELRVVDAASPQAAQRARVHLDDVKAKLGDVDVAIDAGTGRIRAIQGVMPVPPGLSGAEAARAFLQSQAALFDGAELALESTVVDQGSTHVRFVQVLDGVKVLGRSVTVHFLPNKAIGLITADTAEVTAAQRVTGMPQDKAEALALADLKAAPASLRLPVSSEQSWLPIKGQTRLVWRVLVAATEPLGDWEVLVDALTGDVLGRANELQTVTGEGSIYYTSPLGGEPVVRDLTHMTALSALVGDFCKAINDDGAGATEASGKYVYAPDNTHFDEVMVYYHVTRVHDYFKSMGFNGLDKAISATVHYGTNYDNAFFSPWGGGMCFGDGNKLNDLAKEADVIYHEYTHAVTNGIVSLTYSAESGAMSEGYSDYFACTLEGEPKLGEWAVAKMNKPYMRNLDDAFHYPEDIQGEVHADGRIWGCTLWDLHKVLAPEQADNVIHKSRYYLSSRSKFVDGLRGCIEADKALYAGEHVQTIKDVFAKRGISLPTEQEQTSDQARFHTLYKD